MGAWRIIRCNPWSHGGVDYVPEELSLLGFNLRKTASDKALKGVN
jgi:putative component of membrane protein insertase Oxa1/YidC/SpoIIIJ protein YidD